jgi:hypothetical protein
MNIGLYQNVYNVIFWQEYIFIKIRQFYLWTSQNLHSYELYYFRGRPNLFDIDAEQYVRIIEIPDLYIYSEITAKIINEYKRRVNTVSISERNLWIVWVWRILTNVVLL